MQTIKQNIIINVKDDFKDIYDTKCFSDLRDDILKPFSEFFLTDDFVSSKRFSDIKQLAEDKNKEIFYLSNFQGIHANAYKVNDLLSFCDELDIKYYKISDIFDDIFYEYPNKEPINKKYKTLDEKLLNAILEYAYKCFDDSFYDFDFCNGDWGFSKAYYVASLLEDTKEFKKYLLEYKDLGTIQDATDYAKELKDKIKQALKEFSKDEISELKKDNFYDDLDYVLNVRLS